MITIRSIGEMEPKRKDPKNSVTLLENHRDQFGKRLALASIEESQRDSDLWDAMDDASNQLAEVFANGLPYQVLTPFGYVNVSPGFFLGFPNPETFIPQHQSERYKRTAYIGVNFGIEVQIDQNDPDPKRRTGGIYKIQARLTRTNDETQGD